MVKATLYLLHYNNYYNRIVKKEESLSGYLQYQIGEAIQDINFIPNDWVDTSQIVNWQDNDPDYLIVVDEEGNINSRWFVMTTSRIREGQLKLELHRDLVVDYYDPVVSAPCFIEKATLNNSDPMIFNSEDMTFNQIKTSETQLMDETKSAWIVGYCTSKTEIDKENGSGTEPLEIEADFNAAIGADEAVSNITDWKYYKYSNLAGENKLDLAGYPSNIAYCVYSKLVTTVETRIYKVCFNENGGQPLGSVQVTTLGDKQNYTGSGYTNSVYVDTGWPISSRNTGLNLNIDYISSFTSVSDWVKAFNPYYSILDSQVPYYIPIISEEDTIALNNYNGKIIYDSSTEKYYKVEITKLDSEWSETPIVSGNLYENMLNAYNNRASDYDSKYSYRNPGDWKDNVMKGTTPNSSTFTIRTYGAKYNVNLTELIGYGGTQYKIQLSTNRYHLNDAPYDMFAIPFSDELIIYKNNVELFKADKLLAFQAAMALVRKYQSAGYIYDLQLLPFCPVRNMITSSGAFDIGDNVVDYITYLPSSGDRQNIGIVVYASSSSDTFNIPFNINYGDNKKVAAMCDMYRLCSPNYNGQFEFNVALNDNIEYFNVDFTYKPYNPYIHINPNFKNLYGQDFNDARGLVCGGEFSLPAVSNQWDTYELQNKNYQNIFDRQIQNMEVNNSIQREQQQWGIAAGTVGAVAGGFGSGLAAGGIAGGIAGGLIGGAASLAGGIRDYQLSEKGRQEALNYYTDMYGYNLGNIQALPYTLTRTTAFTYNNKIFPILEYYTCTDEEKQALKNKLKYNGMTVMRIGSISEFMQEEPSYIKGKLIRLIDINEDFHILNAIADEINKGVFI